MGLLDAFLQYVNDALPGGLLNPEVPPGGPTELAKGLLGFTPGIGDAISGYDAVQAARQGHYGEAALNAIGVLPFVPSLGGVIKEVGKMPARGIFPKGVTADMVPPGIPQMFGDGLSGTIKQMTTGDYLGRYNPLWGSEGKPFYAIGDNADELKKFMLERMSRSEAGTAAAKSAKFNKSLLGQLQKAGYRADDFAQARSTQSASEYLTHIPTGVKIRISDHDLPLHYEQPDVDLRSWMTMEEKLAAIKKALGK